MSRITLIVGVAGLLLAQACVDEFAPIPAEPVARVDVSPAAPSVAVGEHIQLTATVRDRQGRILTGRTITWSTDPNVVLSVSSLGVVTTSATGSAIVTATSEGKQGRVTVTVVAPVGPVASVTLDRPYVPLLEGEQTQLVATSHDAAGHPLEGRAVAWSSSDASLASVTEHGVVTAVAAGFVEVTATVEDKSAQATIQVSNDYAGYRLVYHAGDYATPSRLFAVRLGDRGSTPLLGPDVLPGWRLSQPDASPDGRRIAFTAQPPGGGDFSVFIVNADGSGLRELVSGEEPAWSPDGTRIAFVVWPWDSDADVWVVDVNGADDAVNLTGDLGATDQRAPAWSPDGSRLAFVHLDATNSSLWTMRPDGSDRRALMSEASVDDDDPAWSPDGAQLVFARRLAAEKVRNLWMVEANGANPRRLLALAGWQGEPAWSPDGRLIAFRSGHEQFDAHKVYTVRSDGTRLARRTDGGGWHATPSWQLQVAPRAGGRDGISYSTTTERAAGRVARADRSRRQRR